MQIRIRVCHVSCIATRRRFGRRKSLRTWIFREVKLIVARGNLGSADQSIARVNLGSADQSITRVNIESANSCIVWLGESANYLSQNRVIYACLPIKSKCVKGKESKVPLEISDDCVIILIGIRGCNYSKSFRLICVSVLWRHEGLSAGTYQRWSSEWNGISFLYLSANWWVKLIYYVCIT